MAILGINMAKIHEEVAKKTGDPIAWKYAHIEYKKQGDEEKAQECLDKYLEALIEYSNSNLDQ